MFNDTGSKWFKTKKSLVVIKKKLSWKTTQEKSWTSFCVDNRD